MFAVIYRGYIKPGFEEEYQKHWKTVATYFVEQRGSLGSTLHKSDDGMWIAYSRWPDKATRDSSWPRDQEAINSFFPASICEAIQGIKASLDASRLLPEICMEIKEMIAPINSSF